MSALNGRITIIVQNGKPVLDTAMAPALAIQVLIRCLGKLYETYILKVGSEKQVWTPDGFGG